MSNEEEDGFLILGLFGPAGSGKDLVADWLVENKSMVKLAYADPMKRFVQRAFGIDSEALWGPSEKRNAMFPIDDLWWFNAHRALFPAASELVNQVMPHEICVDGYLKLVDWMQNIRAAYQGKISARLILQTLGTEWGRTVDPHLWTRYAMAIIRALREGATYTQAGGLVTGRTRKNTNGVVLVDHRFKNEILSLQDDGGYVIRLRRLALETKDEVIGISGHQSEIEGKTIPDSVFDTVLLLEEGLDKVHVAIADYYDRELLWKMLDHS